MSTNPDEHPPGFIEQVRSLFKKKTETHPESILERDFQELIDQGEEQGLLTPEQGDMIQSIFEFKDTIVREVMVPRTEMLAVSSDVSIQTILDLTLAHGHSRLPIYQENPDNIVGMLHVKDLLPYWHLLPDQSIPADIFRKPYFVPETKKIVYLLRELRLKKIHMAIVLDEYGGISGLVTMEDIIEEIIGEIEDEYDLQEPRLKPLEDGRVEVDARLEIEEFEQYFDLEIEEKTFESVGGLVIHILGRVPAVGEKVYFQDLEMTVLEADNRRIRRLLVERKERPALEAPQEP
ncbi:MAG: HlyC/CorC family transporter [Deltaproteobacteria bacterium]|nr:HlyC/CorC family transporter [Deltaproteobacteria bacterium]